jgi:hypothetical protein
VKFSFTGANGKLQREEGICLTMETSSDPFWTVQSMLLADQVDMCHICSQRHQRPIRHICGRAAECLVTRTQKALDTRLYLDRDNLPQPIPLFGPRLARVTEELGALPTIRSQPNATRRKPLGPFPCQMYCEGDGCLKIYYKSAK